MRVGRARGSSLICGIRLICGWKNGDVAMNLWLAMAISFVLDLAFAFWVADMDRLD
jgi:hypothetical protein